MNKMLKALAAIMLIGVLAVSCKKPKQPDDGGNNTPTITYEAVDLGLPSGTLWATFNVGATKPNEAGYYFAWGETAKKDSYSWGNYKYCRYADTINKMTKYCDVASFGYNGFTDNLWTLTPEDDAATVNWGSDWCTPTYEQWRELWEKCENVDHYEGDVYGCRFKGPNGKTIFLPAAGSYDVSGAVNMGFVGNYWSSTLSGHSHSLIEEGPDCALGYHFYGPVPYMSFIEDYQRYKGYSIRAVRIAH